MQRQDHRAFGKRSYMLPRSSIYFCNRRNLIQIFTINIFILLNQAEILMVSIVNLAECHNLLDFLFQSNFIQGEYISGKPLCFARKNSGLNDSA